MKNWNDLLEFSLRENGEEMKDIVACTLSNDKLHESFNNGFGAIEGRPFTAWTKHWVYFPACYDGSEWVASVPRNPVSYATSHIGG